MCIPTLMAAMTGAGGAAAGATAAGGATALANIGTFVGAAGSLLQGVMGIQAANAQAAHIENQRRTENALNAIREQRARGDMRRDMARQRAELAARNINLASPTAVFLGQTAAREMSFDAQAIRSHGQARDQELRANTAFARARGVQSLLRGGFGAAETVLTAAPDLWPGLRGGASA